jgi:hypothetical protein
VGIRPVGLGAARRFGARRRKLLPASATNGVGTIIGAAFLILVSGWFNGLILGWLAGMIGRLFHRRR